MVADYPRERFPTKEGSSHGPAPVGYQVESDWEIEEQPPYVQHLLEMLESAFCTARGCWPLGYEWLYYDSSEGETHDDDRRVFPGHTLEVWPLTVEFKPGDEGYELANFDFANFALAIKLAGKHLEVISYSLATPGIFELSWTDREWQPTVDELESPWGNHYELVLHCYPQDLEEEDDDDDDEEFEGDPAELN